VFALVPEGSAHVQFIFAAGVFFDVDGPRQLKHKVIGFSGDHCLNMKPSAFVLQAENAWNWKKVRGCFDEAVFNSFYAKEENRGNLWSPDLGTSRSDKTLPRMILLPTAILRELGELVVEECSSWEIYKATVRLMIRPNDGNSGQFLQRLGNDCIS
jgi:hypothetical protein